MKSIIYRLIQPFAFIVCFGILKIIYGDPISDTKTLLNGVNKLKFLDTIDAKPMKLSVFGTNAAVLAVSSTSDKTEGDTPIVASTITANGNKVVVLGYTSFATITYYYNNNPGSTNGVCSISSDQYIDLLNLAVHLVPQEVCCVLCKYTSGCRAFAWSNNRCELKAVSGPVRKYTSVNIGFVNVPSNIVSCDKNGGCSIRTNQDITTPDIASYRGQPQENCYGICQSTPGCKAFVWSSDNSGTCRLKDKTEPLIAKNGYTAGIMSGQTVAMGNAVSDANAGHTESKTFMSNILNWMQTGSGPYNIGINVGFVNVDNKNKFIQTQLDLSSLSKYDIVIIDDINRLSDTDFDKLQEYLKLSNKGLIVGISSYYNYNYLTVETMEKRNKLIATHGILWTNLANSMIETDLEANQNLLSVTHVSYATDKLKSGVYDKRYLRLLDEFLQFATATVADVGVMKNLLEDYKTGAIIKNRALPTWDKPITDIKDKQPFFFESWIATWVAQNADPATIKAHPASFYYPSLEFKNWGQPVVNQLVVVDPVIPRTYKYMPNPSKSFNSCQKINAAETKPRVVFPGYTTSFWYPTGMYARPGEVVTIEFPSGTDISPIKVRIGVNKADLSRVSPLAKVTADELLARYPKVDLEKKVDKQTFRIASAFGGLMYIVLPSDYNGKKFEVKFSGSYRAPTYVYGETTKQQWNNIMSQPEAPWGELLSKGKVDLMLPTEFYLKTISNPEEVLLEFNKGIEGIKYLGDLELSAAQPYAPDYRQNVSFGAHSGYPIVTIFKWFTGLGSAKQFCSLDGAWGVWHELGHNMQYDKMYLSNSAEVTNNFFPAYIINKYCQMTIGDIDLVRNKGYPNIKMWEDGGRQYSEWLKDPNIQLLPILQLVDKYGWESLRKLHTFYNKMIEDGDTGENVPGDISQRTNLFYVVYSQIVGEDLSPFLKSWSLPLSPDAEKCVQALSLKTCSLQFCDEYKSQTKTGLYKALGLKC